MAQVKWLDKSFGMEQGKIHAFSDLSLSFSTKTKEKDGGDTHSIEKDGDNPAQFSIETTLSAALGNDVYAEIKSYKAHQRAGDKGRFLIGGKDLFEADFMLTSVSVDDMDFTRDGSLRKAKLDLRFIECGTLAGKASGSGGNGGINYDALGDGSSGGSGGRKKKGAASKHTSYAPGDDVDAISGADGGIGGGQGGRLNGAFGGFTPGKKAVDNVWGITQNAKKSKPVVSHTRNGKTVSIN